MDPSPNPTELPYVTLVSTPDYIIHNFRALQFHEQRSCLQQLQKIVQEATRAKIPCPECGKEFQGSSALGSHRSSKHQVYSSKKRRTLEQEEQQQPQQVAVVEASSPELSTETVMHQSPFVVNIVNGRFSHISIKPPAGCQQWEIITPYSTTSGWPAIQGNALPLPRLLGEQYWTFVSEFYPQHQLRCLSLQQRGEGGEREHQTIEPTEGPTSVESPDWTIGAGEENESAEDEGSELAILRACPAAALGCAHHATTQADMWRHLDHCAVFLRARSVNWQRHCHGLAKHLQALLLSKGVVKQEERALKEEPEVDDLPGDYMPTVFRHLRQQCASLASLIPPGKDDRMLDPIAEINAKEGMELESAQPQPAAHTQATTTSHSGRSSPTESESSTELLARPSSPAPDAGSPATHQRLPHPLHTTKHERPTSLSIVPIAASPSSTPKTVRRTRHEAKKVVYCYFCGAEISCSGGVRKAAIMHIRVWHSDEIRDSITMGSWVAEKEHPEDAPIFRSPKPGEQLFAGRRRHDTHRWWYPVEDWEVRQWEYVGPMPDDIAYRKGPPDPLPPGVERRPRLQVSLEERARYCGTSDKLHAQFIAQVARLVGDHCVAHPHQVARLLATLGYNRSEAQLAQIGVEARRVANIFLDNPSTPSDQLPTILHPFLTLVSEPGDVPQLQDASYSIDPATVWQFTDDERMELWLWEDLL